MTAKNDSTGILRRHRVKPKSTTPPTAGQLCFGLFALFCLLLILRNSEIAIEYMTRGLLLCVRTVIPSLFPFAVLSELIVSGGIGTALIAKLAKPLCRLWGLSEAGCTAVLLGMLCGFPVGARCAVISYDAGQLSKREAEHVLAFSGNPSSAFLISAVGVSLWGNRRFGMALYGTVLVVAVLTGILLKYLRKPCKEDGSCTVPAAVPQASVGGSRLFTDAIKSSTGSILLICAYVVFFSTLMGTLELVLAPLGLDATVSAILFCIFELSGGVSQAATLGNSFLGALLCAFGAGWSGLSVHCQALSVTDGRGLSFKPYFAAKLLQGILCAALFALLITLFPTLTIPAEVCGR